MKDYEVIANATVDFDNLETWEIAEICGFDEDQEEILEAAIEAGFGIKDAVTRVTNGEFELEYDITTYEDLGYYFAGILELPEFAFDFFDFERFGEEMAKQKGYDEEGYLTSYGWLSFQ